MMRRKIQKAGCLTPGRETCNNGICQGSAGVVGIVLTSIQVAGVAGGQAFAVQARQGTWQARVLIGQIRRWLTLPSHPFILMLSKYGCEVCAYRVPRRISPCDVEVLARAKFDSRQSCELALIICLLPCLLPMHTTQSRTDLAAAR